jgi:hypothetical protein
VVVAGDDEIIDLADLLAHIVHDFVAHQLAQR